MGSTIRSADAFVLADNGLFAGGKGATVAITTRSHRLLQRAFVEAHGPAPQEPQVAGRASAPTLDHRSCRPAGAIQLHTILHTGGPTRRQPVSVGTPSTRVPRPSTARCSGASGPATSRRASYADAHDIEYNAIREAAALIDVSPLYKYLCRGPDAHAAGGSGHHPRRDQAGGRRRLVHAVVRRARQGRRRRHDPPARRRSLPLDRRRPTAPLAPPERLGLDVVTIEEVPRRPPPSRSRGRCRVPSWRPRPASRSPTCATSGGGPRRRSAASAIDVSRTGLHRRPGLRAVDPDRSARSRSGMR